MNRINKIIAFRIIERIFKRDCGEIFTKYGMENTIVEEFR